nr:Gfo/Idh/MocA family oxidoreductase [uncultured Microbacterium sp.]
MNPTQRWAIIGTGAVSRMVLADLRECDGVEVLAVHSRTADNARAFAEEFGIPVATHDLDVVIGDPTVDVVYIATPYSTHHEIASRAIRAGKHALVEKPMAMTSDEVEDLFLLARAHDVFVMEGMWMKFNPAFRRMMDEVRNGRIGSPRSVRASFGIPAPDRAGSRWDPQRSPGALLDQGIYPVTLACCVLGTPTAISASGAVIEGGIDTSERFILDFADGRYAFGASSMTEFTELTASVSGTQGWITLATPFWATTTLSIHADGFRAIMAPEALTLAKEGNGYIPMLREVVRGIQDGLRVHPMHTPDDTVEVFRVLDAIRDRLTVPA